MFMRTLERNPSVSLTHWASRGVVVRLAGAQVNEESLDTEGVSGESLDAHPPH